MDSVPTFKFGYSKFNRNQGDVFCFGKSQPVITSSCSRLTLVIRFIAIVKFSS